MTSRAIDLAPYSDDRGHLVSLSGRIDLPFEIKRVFYIYRNAEGLPRAGHAHLAMTELLISVNGSCLAHIEDRAGQRTIALDRPNRGLVLEPMTWLDLTDFSPDCVLLVLADQGHLPDRAITDLDMFRQALR